MVKAILDRVFIRIEAIDKSEGGIYLPEAVVNDKNVGIVESIGEGVTAPVKIGDRVLFHVFDDLPSHDKNVVVVRESSLLGVYENE